MNHNPHESLLSARYGAVVSTRWFSSNPTGSFCITCLTPGGLESENGAMAFVPAASTTALLLKEEALKLHKELENYLKYLAEQEQLASSKTL